MKVVVYQPLKNEEVDRFWSITGCDAKSYNYKRLCTNTRSLKNQIFVIVNNSCIAIFTYMKSEQYVYNITRFITLGAKLILNVGDYIRNALI